MTPKALSREIKFRAFYKEENCMFYSCEVLEWVIWEFSCGEIKVVVQELGTEEKEWNVKDVPIMQYTGLTDKNGKEIYEGDVVTIPQDMAEAFGIKEKKGAVYFTRGCFYAAEDSSASMTNLALYTGEYTGKVIGNIYENPELLTKENK